MSKRKIALSTFTLLAVLSLVLSGIGKPRLKPKVAAATRREPLRRLFKFKQ